MPLLYFKSGRAIRGLIVSEDLSTNRFQLCDELKRSALINQATAAALYRQFDYANHYMLLKVHASDRSVRSMAFQEKVLSAGGVLTEKTEHFDEKYNADPWYGYESIALFDITKNKRLSEMNNLVFTPGSIPYSDHVFHLAGPFSDLFDSIIRPARPALIDVMKTAWQRHSGKPDRADFEHTRAGRLAYTLSLRRFCRVRGSSALDMESEVIEPFARDAVRFYSAYRSDCVVHPEANAGAGASALRLAGT